MLGPDDSVFLGSFGRSIRLTKSALRGPDQIDRSASLLAQEAGGPSPLWDALDTAITALDGKTAPRAIVLVTDGRTNSNAKSFDQVLGRAMQAGIRVFPLSVETKLATQDRGTRFTPPDPSARLRKLAEATGGEFYTFNRGEELGPLLKGVVASLRK